MIIIGGGIAGISLAAALAHRGQPVTLLEAEDQLAQHTSGRSAEQLVLGYGPPAVRELTEITVDMLQEQQQTLDTPWAWPSAFMMVGSDAAIDAAAYPGQTRYDVDALHAMIPELRPDRFTAGSLDKHSLRIRAGAMLDWLTAQAHTVDIRLGERVTAARHTGDGWELTTSQTTYRTETVINAAGAWADPVAELFGIPPLGLIPLRRTAAILELDKSIPADRCMVMKVGGYYYRYEDPTAILASPQEAEPSVAEDAHPRANDVDAMVQEIQADTTLHVTGIRQAWTGLRTEASDGVPVVGFDTQPGFFWLAGQSGYGFQTSLGFAKLAAEVLVDGAAGDWVSAQAVNALAPTRLR